MRYVKIASENVNELLAALGAHDQHRPEQLTGARIFLLKIAFRVHDAAIAARLLGPVQRLIGIGDQLIEGFPMVREYGHAEANGRLGPFALRALGIANFRDQSPHSLAHNPDRIALGLGEQYDELLPTKSRDRVGIAHSHAHGRGRRCQNSIADHVAVLVVDLLEEVDITEQQPHRAAVSLRHLHGLFGQFGEGATIEQAREGINP